MGAAPRRHLTTRPNRPCGKTFSVQSSVAARIVARLGRQVPGATMSPSGNPFAFRGSCHCGQLRVVFATALDPAGIVPRACDCSFCQKHGALYVSDSAGQLSITAQDPAALRRYRQGSNTAEFLLCDRCGVLAAVVFVHDARMYGAVNARSLDGPTGFGNPVPASPQRLAPGEKVARWLQLWVPDVELVASGS